MRDLKKPIPKRRFKEFQNAVAWKLFKLSDVAPLRGGYSFKSTDYKTNGIPIIRISNILSNGTIGDDFAFCDQIEDDDKFLLKNGAALLAMSGATTGKVSILTCKDGDKYYQNQRVGYFEKNEIINYQFLSTIFRSELFKNQLKSVLVAGAQPNVSKKDIDSFEFMMPISKIEQQKIGVYFSYLDKYISLHQSKFEKLKALKKSYLSEMFPAKGENKPKRRFAGFTDSWEKCKLGKFGNVQTCKRIFKEETSINGEIPFYKNGTLGLKPDSYISRKRYEEFKMLFPYPEVGDILISAVGSIGRTAEYTGKDEYFQDSNVVWLKTDNNINKKFLKISYQVINWIIEGSTIKHLYNDNILLSEIMCPKSQSEQQKIGEYFQSLDNLIYLHERKLYKLQDLKKAYLKEMFV